MNHSILKYAVPFAFALGISSSAQAASSSSSCLMFCGEKTVKAAKPEAAQVPLAAPETDLESAILLAQTARKSGDFGGASKILSQLLLFAPDDGRVLGEYGKTLTAQGRSDDALAFLERAIQLLPDEWSLYSAQGVAYDQKGVYPSAQSAYAHALSLKPGEPAVLNNAALSRMQSGDLDGAERLLKQASSSGPANIRIAQNLALVQSLKAARPAVEPAPGAAAMAEVTTAPPPPAPPPPVVAVAPPAAAPMPVERAALPAPQIAQAPLATKTKTASSIDALKTDPTVRMMAVPKDESPVKAPAPKPIVPAKLQLAENASKPAAVVQRSANGTYYVQAGSYTSEERAGKAAQTLDSLGARVTPATVGGHPVFRVRIGPFSDMRQANAAIDQAQSMGQADLKIVSE